MSVCIIVVGMLTGIISAQPAVSAQHEEPSPSDGRGEQGKVASKPLFRDPVYDGAADPAVIWNPYVQRWWMFYTNRRANVPDLSGVTWVHGTRIGIAESADEGATWTYVGTAEIDDGSGISDATHWAPEVIAGQDGTYHMFLTVVPGIFSDWKHLRTIVHLTSTDLRHWGNPVPLKLATDRVIDACMLRLPDDTWRMWYNNERDHKSIYFADSPDLKVWVDRGRTVGDQPGEGPKVFRWRDVYWMVTDVWRGLAVYRSADALTWRRQGDNLLGEPGLGADDQVKGGHPDVVVSGDRAFLFYFTHPGRRGENANKDGYEQRRSSIQVVELQLKDGWLTCDRDKPTYIRLLPGKNSPAEISPQQMQAIYEQVRTPFKYGVVIEPPPGKKVDCPNVFRHGDKWFMVYVQLETELAGYTTQLAVSDDLLHWSGGTAGLGTILERGGEGTWDCFNAGGGVALFDTTWGGCNCLQTYDGRYWMSYMGGAKPGYEKPPLSIGIAATDDPSKPEVWQKLPAPVLRADDSDARAFESETLFKSYIFRDSDETLGAPFVMFYNARAPNESERIGIAVSSDMKSWRRYGAMHVLENEPVSLSRANRPVISGDPQIVKFGDLWVMFYFGAFWKPGAFDTFAASRDLVHWTKWNGPDLVRPSEPWDATFAHKPWVLKHDDVVYHFYCAVGDKGRAIALATSKNLRVERAVEHLNSRTGENTELMGRTYIDFDTDWRFSRGDFATAMMPKFDDSGWRCVKLLHDWSIEGPFSAEYGSGNGYAPGGVGFYRKRFRLDPAYKDKIIAIEFDGIYNNSEIWVNGFFVGGRPYGYSSFECNLTPHLKFGPDENVIAVRVDHSKFADSRWYTGSGIYRHTRLRITDKLRIAHWGSYVTTPQVEEASAVIRIETVIENGYDADKELSLQSDIITADGRVAGSQTTSETRQKCLANANHSFIQQIKIEHPEFWSIESPVLYMLKSRLCAGSRVVDETSTPFGIRTIRFDPDKGFFLNGKQVKIKGVCLHHDAGCLGAAVPEKVLLRRLRLLKELGVNAIRTSHNPPAPELLVLCDRLGLLVKDEAFDEFTPPKNKWLTGWNDGVPSRYGYGEVFTKWSVIDIQDMVRRDRNHPSVIMWSIGNEIDYANDPFSHPVLGDEYLPENPPAENLIKYAKPLVKAVKELDSSRPVTAALANVEMSDAVGLGELLDIVGYNYQEERYPGDHGKYPDRFIFGSENHHNYNDWGVVRDNDYVAGEFLWTGIDYLGEARRWPNRANGSGLLDLCGFKKPIAWFRQSLWSDEPMVYICVSGPSWPGRAGTGRRRFRRVQEHWNWPQNAKVTVYCYTNCPEVLLELDDKPIGTKRLADAEEGVLRWEVDYEPGVFMATGLENGNKVCEYNLKTAGAAERIELLADVRELRPDGKDICHLEFRIVDANGVLVPDADNELKFEVKGPAEIIGIGNGNLNDIDDCRDLVHRAYRGRGLAILQSTKEAGKIIVKVSSSKLKTARLILTPADLTG